MKRLLRIASVLYVGAAAFWMTNVLRDPARGLLTREVVARVGDYTYRDEVLEVRGAYWEERDLAILCLRGHLESSRRVSDYSLRLPVPLLVSDLEGAKAAGFEAMVDLDGLGWSVPRRYLGPPCSPALVSGKVPAERLEVKEAFGVLASYYVDQQEVQALRVRSPDRAAVAAVSVVDNAQSPQGSLRVALLTAEPNAAGEFATGVETQGVPRHGNPAWRWAAPFALIGDGLLWPVPVAIERDLIPGY